MSAGEPAKIRASPGAEEPPGESSSYRHKGPSRANLRNVGCDSVTGFLYGLSLGLYLAMTKFFGEWGAGGGSSGSDQGTLAYEALLTASPLCHLEYPGTSQRAVYTEKWQQGLGEAVGPSEATAVSSYVVLPTGQSCPREVELELTVWFLPQITGFYGPGGENPVSCAFKLSEHLPNIYDIVGA